MPHGAASTTLCDVVLSRALRVLGFMLFATAGVAELVAPFKLDLSFGIWAASYAVFFVGLALASQDASRRRQLVALCIQVPALFAMAALAPCHFGALLTVIVAWQVALLFPPHVTAVWIAGQTAVVGYCLVP